MVVGEDADEIEASGRCESISRRRWALTETSIGSNLRRLPIGLVAIGRLRLVWPDVDVCRAGLAKSAH